MNKKIVIKQRTLFALIFLPIFMIFIIGGYFFQLDFLDNKFTLMNSISILMFFDKFFVEFCIFLLISTIFLNGNKFFATFGFITLIGFVAVNLVQLFSIYFSSDFITPLAVDNLESINLLVNVSNLLLIVLILILYILFPMLIAFAASRYNSRKKYNTSFISIIFIIFIVGISIFFISNHLPQKIVNTIDSYYSQKNLPHTSPVKALYNVFFVDKNKKLNKTLSKDDLFILNKIGFKLNSTSRYPLIKENEHNKSPFMKHKLHDADKPNLIVFFTEGLSARTISVYNKKFSKVTPNLYDFSKSSMVVENYFNHTAATYRGIHGQICSLYPTYGGSGGWSDNFENIPNVKYYGLTDVLKENSYNTIFLNPCLRDSTHIDEMVKQIGFDDIVNAETLSMKFLKGAKPLKGDRLSDQQLYSALIGFLENKVKRNSKMDNPFFLALYSSETHAWQNVKEDGKAYPDSNIKNNSLNTIYNLDDAFGKFWNYYKNSPYSKNTIIVFTSDHAHFYDKSYVDLMKLFKEKDYQKLFVDRIPLIIHDPTRKLPNIFNANNATSIDFAPTIINYLGLENKKNPFLGESIFKVNRKFPNYGIASIGNDFFLIDGNRIYRRSNSKRDRTFLTIIAKFIKKTQELELTNRIWQ